MNIIEKNLSIIEKAKTSTPKALAIASVVGIVAFAIGRRLMKKDVLSSALQASAVAGTVLGALADTKQPLPAALS